MAASLLLPTVVVGETLDPICATWLAERAHVVNCPRDQTGDLSQQLQRADGLVVRTYTRVDRSLLEQAPCLKVVGRAGVGLENIDLDACRQRGIAVVYTPHANTQAVVEYVLAVMLDHVRPRPSLEGFVPASVFHDLRRQQVGVQLDGLTLGILGFGRIGRRLGKIATVLGMNVLVNDLLPEAQLRQDVDDRYDFVDKPTLYRTSDVLSIHVDGRAQNRHLIDRHALDQLQPSCLLINTSRGMVVDSHALAAWARAVRDRGGGGVVDVHDPEPPPPHYPLFGLSNVRLLPHLASRTDRAMQNMSWVVRDVVAVLNNQPPRHTALPAGHQPGSPAPP